MVARPGSGQSTESQCERTLGQRMAHFMLRLHSPGLYPNCVLARDFLMGNLTSGLNGFHSGSVGLLRGKETVALDYECVFRQAHQALSQ